MSTTDYSSLFTTLSNTALHLRKSTREQRAAKLKRLLAETQAMKPEIRQALWNDFRKPAAEVDISEIFPVTSGIKFALSNLKSWMKPKKVRPSLAMLTTRSEIRCEPKGVVLIISPWNFPFMLALEPLIGAIAAGNAVILKPSEMTPHVSRVIAALVAKIFDPSEITVVEGGAETASALLKLPFNHVFFTGSPKIGRIVMEAASKHLADVTLELGGKSPVIVGPGADLDDLADKLVFGKCMNAGQTCVAPDYVLIPQTMKQPLIGNMIRRIEKQFVNPENLQNSPDFARIVNGAHFSRITALIDASLNSGASVAWGNFRAPDQRYLSPTILENVTFEMPVMKEEIFGPVLPILTYDSSDEAVSYVNSQPKPLALYVFAKDRSFISHVLQSTSSGGSCVNDLIIQFSHHHLPFGGVNNSGRGNSHGYYGFKAFSHEKSVLVNPIGWNITKLMYPPYTPGVRWLIDQAIRWF